MHPTIAIFEFLKIREPIFVFSFIGIKLAPYGICFNLSEISIQPMYVFFAELHPLHSKDGNIICLKQMDILSIKANSHSCSHLLLKIHKSGQDYCSGDCVPLSPPNHLRAYHFLVNFPSLV